MTRSRTGETQVWRLQVKKRSLSSFHFKHLPSYLDEFVFRFNRRNTPLAGFETLLGISSQKKSVPLAELMQSESK